MREGATLRDSEPSREQVAIRAVYCHPSTCILSYSGFRIKTTRRAH